MSGGGGGGGGVFSRANSTTLGCLEPQPLGLEVGLLVVAASSVTLNCGRTRIEARRLRPWLLRLSTTAA
jgi:hypothetical protein